MLAGKNKELQKIDKLRIKGKFSIASDKLAKFEKKNHKLETSIRIQIIKALLTANLGFWEKSLGIIEPAISESETLNDQLVLIDAFIVKANCLLFGQQYKKTILHIEETEKIFEANLKSDDDDYRIRKAWLLWIKGNCLTWMGDDKHALETANQGFTIVQSLNDSEMLFNFYELLGICEFQSDAFENALIHCQAGFQLAKDSKNDFKIILFSLRLAEGYRGFGRFTLAMEYLDISIEYSKKLGSPHEWLNYLKAIIYWNMGEIEKSIPIFKETLPYMEKETTHKEIALVLMGKAIIESVEGKIDKAVEFMTEAVNLGKQMDDAYSIAVFSIVLIRMLFDKGEFDKVLEICYSILDPLKKYNKKPYNEPSVYYEMGKTYHVKGDYNLALENVQKALKLYKRINAEIFIARSLFTLLQISIDKNDKVLYIKYLKELEAFVNLHPTNYHKQMYQTGQAIVLKNSTRPRDWTKAVELLLDVVNEKITKYGHSEIALINLCELLLIEFNISGDAQVLKELEFYVEELSELAKKQNVHHLRLEANNLQIMTHWLKAQNSLVDLDFQKAKTLLENTRKIADEKGLYRLAEKLTQQQEKLHVQLSQWDDFIRKYYEFIKE
ncbi:MAG: hypothetical protein ACTSPM_06380 [Candidatus Heimdallarchaeota archaeon]